MEKVDLVKILGNEARKARKELSITQFDLAEKVGKTRNCISLIERGKREPGVVTFLKIWKELGKKTDELNNFV